MRRKWDTFWVKLRKLESELPFILSVKRGIRYLSISFFQKVISRKEIVLHKEDTLLKNILDTRASYTWDDVTWPWLRGCSLYVAHDYSFASPTEQLAVDSAWQPWGCHPISSWPSICQRLASFARQRWLSYWGWPRNESPDNEEMGKFHQKWVSWLSVIEDDGYRPPSWCLIPQMFLSNNMAYWSWRLCFYTACLDDSVWRGMLSLSKYATFAHYYTFLISSSITMQTGNQTLMSPESPGPSTISSTKLTCILNCNAGSGVWLPNRSIFHPSLTT